MHNVLLYSKCKYYMTNAMSIIYNVWYNDNTLQCNG